MNAGHISDMISRLNTNNSLIKRGNHYKENRELYIKVTQSLKLHYPKATKAQLQAIRAEIKQERKKQWLRKSIAFAIALACTIALSYYLLY